MKVYLDNCCYSRPYDDQSYPVISLETQAKLLIQQRIKENKLDLVSSYVLMYEIRQNRNPASVRSITEYVERYSSVYVSEQNYNKVIDLSVQIQNSGIKLFDSYHVACATMAECDYLITTDKRLAKYSSDRIKLINPIDFLSEIEGM